MIKCDYFKELNKPSTTPQGYNLPLTLRPLTSMSWLDPHTAKGTLSYNQNKWNIVKEMNDEMSSTKSKVEYVVSTCCLEIFKPQGKLILKHVL